MVAASTMSIRITGGALRGRTIKTPADYTADLRPTSSRVRESLFNILQGRVEGRRVLDLFAGMGCLGIEALSRGAKEAVFVEKDARHLAILRDNLSSLGLDARARSVRAGLPEGVARLEGAFDLVFIDPPYERGLDQSTLEALAGGPGLAEGGMIIVEKSKHSDIVCPSMLELVRTHRIGDTDLCFFETAKGRA